VPWRHQFAIIPSDGFAPGCLSPCRRPGQVRRHVSPVLNGNRVSPNLRSVSFESLEETRLSPGQAAAYADHARHEVVIAVGRSTIAVRFSRASAAAAFTERFGDALGYQAPDVVIHAVALDGEAYLWLSPDRVRRWPESPGDELLVFFADNVAMHEYLTTSRDVGLHAAVVASGSRVVALIGSSTAGKTTTAIAMVRNGFALYSDERCILQDGRAVPFLRTITVREGGRSALLADAERDCAVDTIPTHGDSTVRPGVLLGERAGGQPLPLSDVFIIEGRDTTPSIEACSLYTGLPALLRSMISRDTGVERMARLLVEMRDVKLYRLTLGTPDATAKSIERTLGEAIAGAAR
jgi:hypothetical protein